MAMTGVCQKWICIYQDCRNKGFMFTIKEVWDQVCSPENQFFNISTCKMAVHFLSEIFNVDQLLQKVKRFQGAV